MNQLAEAEWNSIVPGFDIQGLKANVASALKKKQERNSTQKQKNNAKRARLIEKRLGAESQRNESEAARLDELLKEAVPTVQEPPRLTDPEFIQDLDALVLRVTENLARPRLASFRLVSRLSSELTALKSRIPALPEDQRASATEEIRSLFKGIVQLKDAASENAAHLARTDFPRNRNRRLDALDFAKFSRSKRGAEEPQTQEPPPQKRSSADRALSFFQSSTAKKKEMQESGQNPPGRWGRALAMMNSGSASGAVVQAVSSLGARVMKSARAVKEVGSSALSFIGKRLSSLTSGLMRFLRNPLRSLTGGTGKSSTMGMLFALGALLPTVIVPLLKGITDELSERFSLEAIMKWMDEAWKNSWSYLVQKIRELFGLDKPPTMGKTSTADLGPDDKNNGRKIERKRKLFSGDVPNSDIATTQAYMDYKDMQQQATSNPAMEPKRDAARAKLQALLDRTSTTGPEARWNLSSQANVSLRANGFNVPQSRVRYNPGETSENAPTTVPSDSFPGMKAMAEAVRSSSVNPHRDFSPMTQDQKGGGLNPHRDFSPMSGAQARYSAEPVPESSVGQEYRQYAESRANPSYALPSVARPVSDTVTPSSVVAPPPMEMSGTDAPSMAPSSGPGYSSVSNRTIPDTAVREGLRIQNLGFLEGR